MIYTPGIAIKEIRKGCNQTCTKIMFGGFEISIAMDDSCGAMENLSRSDIQVYKLTNTEGGIIRQEMTKRFAECDGYPGTGELLYQIFKNIEKFNNSTV